MNLFEDLVDELKEENLLEETVIESVDVQKHKPSGSVSEIDLKADTESVGSSSRSTDSPTVEGKVETVEAVVQQNQERSINNAQTTNKDELVSPLTQGEKPLVVEPENIDVSVYEKIPAGDEAVKIDKRVPVDNVVPPKSKTTDSDTEFYRRRALDEVNSLEMVEHVMSGVERELMKTIPNTFEDYEVKQALHEFLQVIENTKSTKHAEAEFVLMQETEKWCSALSLRDKNISVCDLRRYCETTKPSLSSQALMSLAKFYRNSAYSESVRSKFDLIVTKLFAKDVENEKRELVFKAEELVKHIQELYADWSSIPLYSTDEDDSELLLAALKFQDFIMEAENAESFDELIKKDFFKRLKAFKEKTNENFFAPILVAAGVESNVAVGNRYIDLIVQERDSEQNGSLTNKYGVIHDKSISEATSKTLELLDILTIRKSSQDETSSSQKESDESDSKSLRSKKGLLGANKWLLGFTIIVIIFGAVYFVMSWSSSATAGETEVSQNVKIVNLENSSLKEYVQSARISNKTLYGVTNESWVRISYQDKEAVIGKFLQTGDDKGFEKVHMVNGKGETVAFGSKESINIIQ